MNTPRDDKATTGSLLPWFVSGAVLSAIGLLIAYFLRTGDASSTIGVITQPPVVTASRPPAQAAKPPATPEKSQTARTQPPQAATGKKPHRQTASPPTIARKPDAPRKVAAKTDEAAREASRGSRPATPKTPPPSAPRFDIVRVSPAGEVIVAGRAEPGARVEVLLDGRPIAQLQADERGEWVATPDMKLPPGQHEITLRSHVKRGPDSVAVVSEQSVSVAGAGQAGRALVVLSSPDAPSRILQKPQPVKKAPVKQAAAAPGKASTPPPAAKQPPAQDNKPLETPTAGTQAKAPPQEPPPAREKPAKASPARPEPPKKSAVAKVRLSLQTVDYDENGDIFFSGAGTPGSRLRIYVDNRHLGDTRVDGKGRWSFKGNAIIAPGPHALRVDRIDGDGSVLARVAAPFMRAAPAAVAQLKKSLKKEAEATVMKKETAPVRTTEVATASAEDASAASAEPAAGKAVRNEALRNKPPKPARVIIQPGDNLWTIARNLYGKGMRYTVIYEANRDQIRDPDLIYPGQIFTTPKPPGG